jgi:hypothetical protein
MDPNATLSTMREAISLCDRTDIVPAFPKLDVLETIRDCAEALDQWLSKGGFLPDEWAR